MRRLVLLAFLSLAIGHAYAADKPLPDKLIDVIVDYIKTNGPDEDSALFISFLSDAIWERRDEMADATLPFLKDKSPAKVSGALAVLYRLRVYRPQLGGLRGVDEPVPWEKIEKHAIFYKKLDKAVFESMEHFHALKDEKVLQNLALYLGVSPSPESKKELLRIAKGIQETAKEQALICLAWHRDQKDMDDLLMFMLEDSRMASSLPYHFRNSYGKEPHWEAESGNRSS